MSGKSIALTEWISQNEASFKPPVCNKLMFGAGQLKVMFVGGPNIRKDYHLEEGEELFYMIKGDMCLNIIEKGKPKAVPIKEGQIFLLPRKIPHSPQRFENTTGLVIERERRLQEMDCLRYYCEQDDLSNNILYERWFHCDDLGSQLAPIIKEYFASEEYKTGKPGKNSMICDPAFHPDEETTVMEPFSLKEWIDSNRDTLSNQKELMLFSKTECQLRIATDSIIQCGSDNEEVWVWIYEDKGIHATLASPESTTTLHENDVHLITSGERCTLTIGVNTIAITVMLKPS